MGIILFISGSPAGNLNDGDALFGLDVVSDVTVLFSVSSSSVFVSFSSITDGDSGIWMSSGESALGGVVCSSASSLALRRRFLLRPQIPSPLFL